MSNPNVYFRRVLHGYDPTQVNQHVNQLAQESAAVWQEAAERTLQVNKLETANCQLKDEVKRHAQRARELEEAQMEAAKPTYEGLGERIISILTLANEEAIELRTRALADAVSQHALAYESALATRQDADDYAVGTRNATDDEAARILEDTKQHANSLLNDAKDQGDSLLNDAKQQADSLLNDADRQTMARQDADRQTMTRREEAEAVYERARASSAAAAIDFETTLAARRDTSALDFAAQVTTAEQQLVAVRLRSEQIRHDSERAQQVAAAKAEQQLEQAMAHAQTLVAEARAKAERIRENSAHELAGATERRDHINAQLSIVRRDLAALGDVTRFNPVRLAEPAGADPAAAAVAARDQQDVVADARNGEGPPQTGDDLGTDELTDDEADVQEANPSQTVDDSSGTPEYASTAS
jgi:cell division septum initiation protein DivIVA